MKLKLLPSMSQSTKQTLTGGVLAGAIVGAESGMSWFVAGYPQILKDKLNPNLPRNGALLANLAPAGYGLMVKRKGGSAKKQNMANGFLFYDIPKLLNQIAYNVAYQMGLPQVGLRRTATPMRLNVRPSVNRAVATPTMGSRGKYAVKQNGAVTAASYGLGRYGR